MNVKNCRKCRRIFNYVMGPILCPNCREAEEAKKRDEEYKKHITEMEALGYDMSAYKEEEKIGGASAEEVQAEREKAEGKCELKAGKGIKGKWAAKTENGGQYMGDCTHDCKHCTRRNCPNRVEPL